MPPSPERSPHAQETLIFSQPEAAQAFREKIEGQLKQTPKPTTDQRKAVIAQAVTDEFVAEGEVGQLVREPWLHTTAEHTEVQHLVDVAFHKDLPAALAQARQSKHYPRNLDLLHDVLTSEMYQLLKENKLNQQSVVPWVLFVVGLLAATVLAVLVLIVLL